MLHSRIFPFNPLATNCVVLWNEGSHTCTVVDPGMSSPEGLQQLTDFFKAHDLTPEAILLTHGHFDHVWGVDKLLALYSVPVYMHPADKDITEKMTAGFSSVQGFSFLQHKFTTEDVADGEVLTTAGTAWKVIHTPGHKEDSICFYFEQEGLIFTGDTLFQESIGRTDLPGGDMPTLQRSLVRLMRLPAETTVYPGHGYTTTIGHEKQYNPFI